METCKPAIEPQAVCKQRTGLGQPTPASEKWRLSELLMQISSAKVNDGRRQQLVGAKAPHRHLVRDASQQLLPFSPAFRVARLPVTAPAGKTYLQARQLQRSAQ